MAKRAALVLNLDAELELAAGEAYRPSSAVERLVRRFRPLARDLLGERDRMIDEGPPVDAFRGWRGMAWCPTPGALRLLSQVGAIIDPCPPFAVLRRANDRAFGLALLDPAPGEALVEDARSLREHLRRLPAGLDGLLLKRRFKMAGRGQRRIEGGDLDPRSAAWVDASKAFGGLHVEPILDVLAELSLHGILRRDGSVSRGAPVISKTRGRGGHHESRLALEGELDERWERDLARAFERTTEALFELGYHGPLGIDGLLHRSPDGTLRLRAPSDVNARYTMAWACGMGAPASAFPPA